MREVIFEATALGVMAALRAEGRLVAVEEARARGGEVTDRLFVARVVAVEPQLDAAFLDYGGREPGYLTARDGRALAGGVKRPIAKLVQQGQKLLVQGLREADQDKGPRFTADIRLFGLYLVFRPHQQGVEAARTARRREREELLARAQTLFGSRPFVLRRFAARAPDAALLGEAQRLEQRWRDIQAAFARASRPGPVDVDDSPLDRMFRWAMEQQPDRLEAADPGLLAGLRRRLGEVAEELRPQLERLAHGRAFVAAGVDREIEEALAPVVPLDGGGRLVVQETLACTAIDVDGEGREALALNLEAAAEVGRQLRLRNIGGHIVVDFVTLKRAGERRRLEQALARAVRDDPQMVQIHPVAGLGLVPLTRARRGRSLRERFRRPCGVCRGEGSEPSLEARLDELYWTLRELQTPPDRIRTAPDLYRFLTETGPHPWLSQPALVQDSGLPAGTFRIETAR